MILHAVVNVAFVASYRLYFEQINIKFQCLSGFVEKDKLLSYYNLTHTIQVKMSVVVWPCLHYYIDLSVSPSGSHCANCSG